MSIQRIGPDDVEGFTLQTNPSRTYSSSSSGHTGSVQLFARSSPTEKDVSPSSPFLETLHNDHDSRIMLETIVRVASGTTDISNHMTSYLERVNDISRSARKQQTAEIVRFEPSVSFSVDSQKKNVIRNVLYPYYRSVHPTYHWAYTNYNTLNFYSASNVPQSSVLLYPNSSSLESSTTTSGSYSLGSEFSFEFYINPRYTTESSAHPYRAGTLFHLSSSYAVSIVSGTLRDATDRPSGFRVLLQVSGGADTSPSQVLTSTPLAYFSDDNSLLHNHWHHVAIRWSSSVNDRTGSFVIDGKQAGTFVIPHATIAPARFTSGSNPDVLCVGNYYRGNNAGANSLSLFFNQNVSQREGLTQLINDSDATTNTPAEFVFDHPLNAEVHELKIHSKYLTMNEISSSMTAGPLTTGSLIFYVPPFFVRESPTRVPYGTNANGWPTGGIMQTPFASISGSTVDPFNIALSFGVNGRMLNLENFTRDFAQKNYPRLLHLSSSEIGSTLDVAYTANSILYDETTNFFSGSIRKRNVSILPNDNGLFKPNFALLISGSFGLNPASGSVHDRFVNDLKNADLSIVSLSEMFPTGAIFASMGGLESGSIFEGIAGSSPESIGVDPGDVYTILQRTRDTSSNAVVFFDISNLFYGQRIMPGSFSITDSAITGTQGKLGITLKDNAFGSLYRADSRTPHAKWNNVGDILYNEGVVIIKAPTIPFFGKDQFEISMKGEQNIHIMKVNAIARSGEINSSSNPTYQLLSASTLAYETDPGFVYITGLNFHDDNLNVIMKTKFSQPIMKRNSDRYLFKVKMDF